MIWKYIINKSLQSFRYLKSNKNTTLSILCIILIIILILQYRKGPKVITISKDNVDLIQKVQQERDVNGKLISKLDQIAISSEEKDKRIDSLSKALKIKPKFIKGEDLIISRVDTVIKEKTVIFKDSSGSTEYKIEKHDHWMDATANISKDSSSLSIQMRDSLSRVEVVNNPLFGKPKRNVFLRNYSPYNTITSGYSYTTIQEEPILTIGPYIGVDISGKPSIGICLQYPVIKIRKKR